MALPLCLSCAGIAAVDFDADPLDDKLIDAFNNRRWEDVKSRFAKDAVFHRGAQASFAPSSFSALTAAPPVTDPASGGAAVAGGELLADVA